MVTEPASRSAWVAVYVARAGDRGAGGQAGRDRAALVGRLVVADRERPVDGDVAGVGDEVAVGQGVADRVVVTVVELLSIDSDGVWMPVAVALSVGSMRVPPAGVPVAVAVLVTEPASRSAWVDRVGRGAGRAAPGARSVVAGRGGVDGVVADATRLIVTLPVLVTRYW